MGFKADYHGLAWTEKAALQSRHCEWTAWGQLPHSSTYDFKALALPTAAPDLQLRFPGLSKGCCYYLMFAG